MIHKHTGKPKPSKPKPKPANYPGGLHRSPGRLISLEQRLADFDAANPTKPPRAKVLVTVTSNGHLALYGPDHIDAKILNLPLASTVANEIQVEQLVESVLPLPYRRIYFPGSNCRAIGNCRTVTLDSILRITNALEAMGSTRYQDPRQAQLAVMEA